MNFTEEDDPFGPLFGALNKWFYEPDLQAIRIVMGTVCTHQLNIGDPAWLFVVAPPGSGKTTATIMSATGLPQVQILSSVTENTFLSGFYGHREPGLLERLGQTTQNGEVFVTHGDGIFLMKDFTTTLSMRREKRAEILSQLREIQDGYFKRDFGTGQSKIWQGRVTILAAVTPVIDRHYSIFTVLGERFLQVRWHRPNSEEAGEWAIRQQGQEKEIQSEMRSPIKELFASALKEPPTLSAEMQHRIASLAEIVAIGRTHVFRSGYGSREIEYVPEPEANTRISKGLAAIGRGIAALHRHPKVGEEEYHDIIRIGLDCLPDRRRRILEAVAKGKDLKLVHLPETLRRRELEELEALKLIEKRRDRPGSSPLGDIFGDRWSLTDRVRRLLRDAQVFQDQDSEGHDAIEDSPIQVSGVVDESVPV